MKACSVYRRRGEASRDTDALGRSRSCLWWCFATQGVHRGGRWYQKFSFVIPRVMGVSRIMMELIPHLLISEVARFSSLVFQQAASGILCGTEQQEANGAEDAVLS
jgi:hypothetical protein